MKLIIETLILSPFENETDIETKLKQLYDIKGSIKFIILRKSLDARKKSSIVWNLKIEIEVDESDGQRLLQINGVSPAVPPRDMPRPFLMANKISAVIAGSGPAGMFCALRLIEAGVDVTILERGVKVEDRLIDIEKFKNTGILNPQSNVLFGEGGAGTYSDGRSAPLFRQYPAALFTVNY